MSLLPVAVKHKVRLTIKSPREHDNIHREFKLNYLTLQLQCPLTTFKKKCSAIKKKMTQSADRYDTFLYSKCPISATLMS